MTQQGLFERTKTFLDFDITRAEAKKDEAVKRGRNTQAAKILEYLQSGHRITPLDALRLFGCFRLGARVWDLRKEGYNIASVTKKVGDGKWVAEYFLEGRESA